MTARDSARDQPVEEHPDRGVWTTQYTPHIVAKAFAPAFHSPVDLLPEAIQQQVREGKICAHVAMKF